MLRDLVRGSLLPFEELSKAAFTPSNEEHRLIRVHSAVMPCRPQFVNGGRVIRDTQDFDCRQNKRITESQDG